MSSKLVYVTYADGAYERNIRRNAWFAKTFAHARLALCLTRRDLEADPIFQAHVDVFNCARGAGYWAWKPWAILQAMNACQAGDVIYYHDCGFGLRYKSFLRPRKLLEFTMQHGFIAGVKCPQYGPNRRWNRKKCLNIMGAEKLEVLDAPSVQATLSFWQNTQECRKFVEDWLSYCLNFEAIRDAYPDEIDGEDPDFIEHRHDQAILTNLAILTEAPVLEPSAPILQYAKSASMLELDLRAKDSAIYNIILKMIIRFGNFRRSYS